jgi:WD40 repeat protein
VLVFATAVALLAPVAFGLDAARRNEAMDASRRAADEAVRLMEREPDVAGQLAAAAYRIAPSRQAQQALVAATVRSTASHTGPVHDLTPTGDGERLVTVSDDGAALWDVSNPARVVLLSRFAAAGAPPTAVAAGADDVIATGGRDGAVRLWRANGDGAVRPLAAQTGHAGRVLDIAISPDGTLLAAAGAEGTVRLWDVRDPRRPVRLAALTSPTQVLSMAFAPGGTTLAAAGPRRLTFWDVADPARPARLSQRTVPTIFTQVAYGGDERLLLASVHSGPDGSTIGTVTLHRMVDGRRPRQVRTLVRVRGDAGSIAISPDGATVVVAAPDGTITLWDASDPVHPLTRATLETGGRPTAVAFGPAAAAGTAEVGRYLVAADGSSARLWDLDLDTAPGSVCARVRRQITPRDWERHVPGWKYDPACPAERSG